MNIVSAKTLSAAITRIGKAGAKLDTEVHDAAIQAMLHAKEYGDCTHLTRLLFALPKQSRAKAFKFYVTQFCPVYWAKSEKDGKVTEGFRLSKTREDADWRIVAASEVFFWDYTKEVTQQEFDAEMLLRRLKGLVTTIDNKLEEMSEGDRAFALHTKAALAALVDKVPANRLPA